MAKRVRRAGNEGHPILFGTRFAPGILLKNCYRLPRFLRLEQLFSDTVNLAESLGIAGKKRAEIRDQDVTGLKYFDKLPPLLERLHDDGCQ